MYKKLFCLTCFVLLMLLSSGAFGAAVALSWDAEEDANNYWHAPNNWDPNQVPTAEDDVTIGTGYNEANYPVIMADTNAYASTLGIDGQATGDNAIPSLTIESGAKLVSRPFDGSYDIIIVGSGWVESSQGILNNYGGDVNVTKLWVMYNDNPAVPSQFTQTGGSLVVTHPEQDGGFFEVSRGDDCMSPPNPQPTRAWVHLDGGVVECDVMTFNRGHSQCGAGPWLDYTVYGSDGRIDITGGTIRIAGRLNFQTDVKTMGLSALDRVEGWDVNGWMTAYGVGTMADGNIVNHERARLVYDYGWRSDKTTITAYQADWGEAYDLKPKPYTPDYDPVPTLTWKPGDYVGDYVVGKTTDGHHVKFGPVRSYVADTSIAYPLGWTTYASGPIGHFRAETNSLDPASLIPDMNALELGTIYYWRVVEVNNLDVPKRYHSLVQAFKTVPAKATEPDPEDGATVGIAVNAPLQVQLSWKPGYYAADVNGHEVYFGTDWDEVNDADTNDAEYEDTTDDPCFLATSLEINTVYYWRIDEANSAHPEQGWKGDVWSFYVGNYRSITEFASATDSNTAWDDYWVDWWEPVCGSGWGQGSLLFFSDGSMTYDYANNDRFDQYGSPYGLDYYSEARYDAGGKNWVYGDPDTTLRALVLNFQGDADNAADPNYDRMWLAVEDSAGVVKAVTHPEPGAHARAVADEWNIDLRDLSGLDLSSVDYLYLGFGIECNPGAVGAGTPGGTGVVVFNSIRSYMERCVGKPGYTIPGDIDGDCFVDMADVGRFVDYWLARDRLTGLPKEVNDDDPNMLARYEFEDNYLNDANGTLGSAADGNCFAGGTCEFVNDANRPNDVNTVLYLDQDVNEMVVCGTWGEDGNFMGKSFTIMAWVKQEVAQDWADIIANGERAWKIEFGMLPWLERQIHFATQGIGIATEKKFDNNIWHHVAGTFEKYPDANGGMGRVYVNGVLEAESECPGPYEDHANPAYDPNITIGGQDLEGDPDAEPPTKPTEDRLYYGWIDDARVYNRLLSEEEVMWLAGKTGKNYYPIIPPQAWGNFYDEEPRSQRWVNMRDWAVLGNNWLKFDLWPLGL